MIHLSPATVEFGLQHVTTTCGVTGNMARIGGIIPIFGLLWGLKDGLMDRWAFLFYALRISWMCILLSKWFIIHIKPLYINHHKPYISGGDIPYITGGYWGYKPFTKWGPHPQLARCWCCHWSSWQSCALCTSWESSEADEAGCYLEPEFQTPVADKSLAGQELKIKPEMTEGMISSLLTNIDYLDKV